MSIEAAVKRCRRCLEVKALTEYHRNKNTRDGLQNECKICKTAQTIASRVKRREEMGDEAFLEWERIKVQVHRQRTGNVTGKEYAAAQRQALRMLKERHRKEYDHLLLLARRGELTDTG